MQYCTVTTSRWVIKTFFFFNKSRHREYFSTTVHPFQSTLRVTTWLRFVAVTNVSGQTLTLNAIWRFGELQWWILLFTVYTGADDRLCVWGGVRWYHHMEWIALGGGVAKVWTGLCFGHKTKTIWQMPFWIHRVPWKDPEAYCCANRHFTHWANSVTLWCQMNKVNLFNCIYHICHIRSPQRKPMQVWRTC